MLIKIDVVPFYALCYIIIGILKIYLCETWRPESIGKMRSVMYKNIVCVYTCELNVCNGEMFDLIEGRFQLML